MKNQIKKQPYKYKLSQLNKTIKYLNRFLLISFSLLIELVNKNTFNTFFNTKY